MDLYLVLTLFGLFVALPGAFLECTALKGQMEAQEVSQLAA